MFSTNSVGSRENFLYCAHGSIKDWSCHVYIPYFLSY